MQITNVRARDKYNETQSIPENMKVMTRCKELKGGPFNKLDTGGGSYCRPPHLQVFNGGATIGTPPQIRWARPGMGPCALIPTSSNGLGYKNKLSPRREPKLCPQRGSAPLCSVWLLSHWLNIPSTSLFASTSTIVSKGSSVLWFKVTECLGDIVVLEDVC